VLERPQEDKPGSEPDWGDPTVRDRRGACGNVALRGVGDEPDPKSVRAPHFYPDQSTRRLARRPSELYAQIELGKAYVLSGEHDKALAWLSELHRKVPDQPDVQHLIPYF
jgi:hypothetical protein